MIIYVDILMIVNLFVNYFLLLATMMLSHLQKRRIRILGGAVLGSVFSLMIFLPDLNFWITWLLKLMLGGLLVFVTFGIQPLRIYCKNTLIFFAVNFLFAGVMMLLWLSMRPDKMFFHNGVVYFSISPLFLVFSTVVSYMVIKGIYWILYRRVSKEQITGILIEEGGNKRQMFGLNDTGNRLRDPFSGLPVTVCEFSAVSELIPEEFHSFFLDPTKAEISSLNQHPWRRKIKVVPYTTVGEKGVMAAFEPDGFYCCKNEKMQKVEMLIGVTSARLSDGEYQAVIHTQTE